MDNVKGISRKERAARTRRAIVKAATVEFRANGYHGTTMTAIAKRAGVVVQTVYFVFHTKPLLLTATIDNAVTGEHDPLPPELTSWWQEGTTTANGRLAIELCEERAVAGRSHECGVVASSGGEGIEAALERVGARDREDKAEGLEGVGHVGLCVHRAT